MNRIKTMVFNSPEGMDKYVNELQSFAKVFATQTHIGFSVDGTPKSYVAVVFYRDDSR